MLTGISAWRAAWDRFGLPADAVPEHPELGVHYPWKDMALHALSSGLQRKIQTALGVLATARQTSHRWRVSVSGGKDSTVLLFLLHRAGWIVDAVSCRDDGDFPGEGVYLTTLCASLGYPLAILRPDRPLWDLVDGNLTEDICSKKSELAQATFYRLMDAHLSNGGYTGTLWGVRAEESKGRRMRRRVSGLLYNRQDGTGICQPLGDWTAADIHAFLLLQEWPIQPLYLCCDLNTPWNTIRQDWYFAGGYSAAIFGHYLWLRRWFPALWEKAAQVDPRIRLIS